MPIYTDGHKNEPLFQSVRWWTKLRYWRKGLPIPQFRVDWNKRAKYQTPLPVQFSWAELNQARIDSGDLPDIRGNVSVSPTQGVGEDGKLPPLDFSQS